MTTSTTSRLRGTPSNERWWETAVVYQVYPRSFQDSNDDGVGDLVGIQSRLGYLKSLGVTAVWLSPIYPSPMVDFGYDVSNYTDVDPIFGNMEQFSALVTAAHDIGLRVILDFVPNHTSNMHPWFLESRSSRSSPKRDWYIWKDPVNGGPPNNWVPHFGGKSAWEWDEVTGQYYLHLFTKEQPDLNWDNPEVQKAMFEAMEFWLKRGVDGFRVDVICLLAKDALFRDDPPNPAWDPSMPWGTSNLRVNSEDQPRVHSLIRHMRSLVNKYNAVLVGEIWYEYPRLVKYYGEDDDECQLPFNFGLIFIKFTASAIAQKICCYEKELATKRGAWPNWVLGNHDQPRIATRAGRDCAAVAQMLLLTLRGTPTMYYGDEIGMRDVYIPPEKVQDPMAKAKTFGSETSRDPARTPMQHNSSENAGFTRGKPWLPIAEDFEQFNVETQARQSHSLLNLVRLLLKLRNEESAVGRALQRGAYEHILPPVLDGTVQQSSDDVLAYRRVVKIPVNSGTPPVGEEAESLRQREEEEAAVVVALNLSGQVKKIDLGLMGAPQEVLVSTYMDKARGVFDEKLGLFSEWILRPYEGVLLRQ